MQICDLAPPAPCTASFPCIVRVLEAIVLAYSFRHYPARNIKRLGDPVYVSPKTALHSCTQVDSVLPPLDRIGRGFLLCFSSLESETENMKAVKLKNYRREPRQLRRTCYSESR
jgi:hypothetical protein